MTPDNPHLFDQFALALLIADADSLRILALSPTASQLSGYSDVEACALTLEQLFPHPGCGGPAAQDDTVP